MGVAALALRVQFDDDTPRRCQSDAQVALIGVCDVNTDLDAGDRQCFGDVDRVANARLVVLGDRTVRR